jgi:hypothetical protein
MAGRIYKLLIFLQVGGAKFFRKVGNELQDCTPLHPQWSSLRNIILFSFYIKENVLF